MYVAIESITKKDGTYTVSTFKKENRNDAEAAYHSILTSAAKSEHPIHAATLLNEEGYALRNECYKHEEEQKEGEK